MSGPYRFSRCTDVRNAPQTWHWATIDGDKYKVQRELADAIRTHVPAAARLDVVAEVKSIIERIEACQAIDPDQVQNLARDRNLWEVRFQLQSARLCIRIYVTEIAILPEHIIALLAHRKVVDVGEDEIADLQNEEIDEASRRWVAGRANYWGVV